MTDITKMLDDTITEDKSLDLQREIIEARIASADKPQAEVMLITPALAKWFTTEGRFIQNRQLRNEKISHYGQAMREPGGWALTGQPIIFEKGKEFGGGGRLLDGYHRCRACMITKRSFVTLVVFGIEASAFKLIDTGAQRSVGDAFRIADIPNAALISQATRWIKIYTSRDRYDRSMRWENSEALAFHDTLNKELVQQLVPDAKRISKASRRLQARKSLLPKAQVLAYLYTMCDRPRYRVVLPTLMDQLAESRGVGVTLYKYLASRHDNGTRINENMRTVVLDAARDALIQRQNLTLAMLKEAMNQYSDSQTDGPADDA